MWLLEIIWNIISLKIWEFDDECNNLLLKQNMTFDNIKIFKQNLDSILEWETVVIEEYVNNLQKLRKIKLSTAEDNKVIMTEYIEKFENEYNQLANDQFLTLENQIIETMKKTTQESISTAHLNELIIMSTHTNDMCNTYKIFNTIHESDQIVNGLQIDKSISSHIVDINWKNCSNSIRKKESNENSENMIKEVVAYINAILK